MPRGVTAFPKEPLKAEMKRVSKCAKGIIPGIMSVRLDMTDLRKLKDERDDALQEADTPEQVPSVWKVSRALYAWAAFRDAKYVLSGRKFMRCCGLNGKQYGAFGRILHWEWYDDLKKRGEA